MTSSTIDRDADYFSREDGMLLIPAQMATSVFTNSNDQVVIRQQGEMGQDDPFVVIDRAHISLLISKLKEYVP